MVTDDNGSYDSVLVNITEPSLISGTGSVISNYNGAQISCPASADGAITVSANGGTGALSYSIDGSPYQLSNVFSGLGAGSHSILVKDANACIQSLNPVTLTPPASISGSGSVTTNYNGTQISCSGSSDGAITISANGGTGALSYSIDGNAYQSGNVFNGLGAGSHSILVKDANGCTQNLSAVNITPPSSISGSGAVTSNYNGAQISCATSTDGMISLSASGGTGTLTYSIDGNAYQSGTVFNGLGSGSHTIMVKDANGCTKSLTAVNITPPSLISGSGAVTSNYNGAQMTCSSSTDGLIAVSASGGTGSLTYNIDGNAYQSGNVFTGLGAGSHSLNIKDANGCTQNLATVSITPPTSISGTGSVTSNYNGSQISCPTSTNGLITVNASGGTGSLTYNIDGSAFQSGNVFTGLSAGGHSLIIKDANGCTQNLATVNITPPPSISGTGSVTSNYNGSQISCPTSTNGVITVNASGGTGSLTYNIDGSAYHSGNMFTGLGTGSHTLIVKDANGCIQNLSAVNITAPSSINGSGSVSSNYNGAQISCTGSSDGAITISASGGTGSLSFNIDGSAFQSGNVFNGLSAGSHMLMVKDTNGCAVSLIAVSITPPSPITISSISQTSIPCYGGTSTVTIVGSGGTSGYTYTFNGSTNATGVFISVSAGKKYYSVNDANACSKSDSFTVTQPAFLTGTLSVTACNSYYWSTSNQNYTVSGFYPYAMKNATGCDSLVTLMLTINRSSTGDTAAYACKTFAWYGSTYTNSGDFTHTFINSKGCDSVVTLHLAVYTVKPNQPGLISGNTIVCNSDVNTYSVANDPNVLQYVWTAPAGATIVSGQGTNTVVVSFGAGFTASGALKVDATNPCGINNTTRQTTIQLGAKPSQPLAISGPTDACPYITSSTIAYYTINKVSGATSYNWTISDLINAAVVYRPGTGLDDTIIGIRYYTSTLAGNTITVIAQNNCGFSLARSLQISTYTLKLAVPLITGNVNPCQNSIQTYIASCPTATSFNWTVSSSVATILSGQGTNTLTIQYKPSFVRATLAVSASSVCGVSVNGTLLVNKGVGCRMINLEPSLSEISTDNEMSIYPNPSKGDFNVSIHCSEKLAAMNIELVNEFGQIVFKQTLPNNNGSGRLNINKNLTNGVYLVHCTIGNLRMTRKVMISR